MAFDSSIKFARKVVGVCPSLMNEAEQYTTSELDELDDTLKQLVTGSEVDQQKGVDLLCERFAQLLLLYFKRRGFTQADCQDLTQETLAIAIRHIREGNYSKTKAKFSAWILTIAKFLLFNQNRRRRRLTSLEEQTDLETGLIKHALIESGFADPVAKLSAVELFKSFDQFVDCLPEEARNVAILHYKQGLTRQEIVKKLKKGDGSIKGILERIRLKLKSAMHQFRFEP